MLRTACLALVAILLVSRFSSAEDRHALVIGNGKYEGDAALRNPANDADALEATLKKLDFKVVKKTDVDIDGMEQALAAFRKSLKKGDVALFFYAGHGLQVKGENFLVPLKADPDDESQVKRKCFAVDQVLGAMDDSESYIKVVILDCCRNNPFKRSWGTRSKSEKGLSAISEIPNGTVIAFATAPGTLAADGKGANSPYTTHLVASFNNRPKEGLELVDALREASRAVKKETGQVPWLNLEGSLDKFYLWRDLASASKTPAVVPVDPPAKTPATFKLIQSKYYPLAVGNKWEYRGKTLNIAHSWTVTREVVDIDERGAILSDLTADPQRITVKEDGIYAHRSTALVFEPKLREELVRKGDKLSTELLLKFTKLDEPAIGDSWKVDRPKGAATATIMRTDDTVKVPAGTFTGTVVVQDVYSDGRKETTWFAPGTGIVKIVQEDSEKMSLPLTNVIELTEFKTKSK